jgi:integration host factor subunit alpha
VTRKTATREDLTEAVQRTIGLSLGEAKTLVSQVLEMIAITLEHGETVKLSSFGSFVVRQKGERLGRNPKTLEPATIRPRRVLVFKPSPILKQQINSPPDRTSVRAIERNLPERNP